MTEPEETTLNWEQPAEMKSIELVCAEARQAFEQYIPLKKERFAVELLLREALNNAVLHGCRLNPQLGFHCTLELSPRRAIIEVTDEGPGFNWRKDTIQPFDNYGDTGRGRQIYSLYAHSVKYNTSGNSVRLTRTFGV